MFQEFFIVYRYLILLKLVFYDFFSGILVNFLHSKQEIITLP